MKIFSCVIYSDFKARFAKIEQRICVKQNARNKLLNNLTMKFLSGNTVLVNINKRKQLKINKTDNKNVIGIQVGLNYFFLTF